MPAPTAQIPTPTLPPLTSAEEMELYKLEQSPWSAIVQWNDPNYISFNLQWYIVFGVPNSGNCSHSWTYGRSKEQAEAIARRFSPRFLGYFEQTSTNPWPAKEILKIAQQKQLVPQADFSRKDPLIYDQNGNVCW
jgi:hypothetical protein